MTNIDRAVRAEEAIATFTDFGMEPLGELPSYVADMLADILHLCDQRKIDFDKALSMARHHFEDEAENLMA